MGEVIRGPRVHSLYARLGAVRWTYKQQQELQDRGTRAELLRRWDDIVITRRRWPDDVWTIDSVNRVLDKGGVWHEEPSPSNRSDAFIAATRHTLEEAIELCQKHGYWDDPLKEGP